MARLRDVIRIDLVSLTLVGYGGQVARTRKPGQKRGDAGVAVLLRAPELAPILTALDTVGAQRGEAAVHGLAPGLVVGLRTPRIAVAPGNRLAGRPHVEIAEDLPGYLRRTLVDGHLGPVLDGLHQLARIGRRTLLGSLASAVAYSLTRSADALPGP